MLSLYFVGAKVKESKLGALPIMDQRLSMITLGVDDIQKSKTFYEKLGWQVSPHSQEGVIFFQIGGMVLSLYSKQSLAEDACLELGHGFGGITLAYNVRAREDVPKILEKARQAGGKTLKPAADAFWGGYSGYFADPDGYPIEVAWNPFWPLDAQGNVQLDNA